MSSSNYDTMSLNRTSCCCHLFVIIDKLMLTVDDGLL